MPAVVSNTMTMHALIIISLVKYILDISIPVFDIAAEIAPPIPPIPV